VAEQKRVRSNPLVSACSCIQTPGRPGSIFDGHGAIIFLSAAGDPANVAGSFKPGALLKVANVSDVPAHDVKQRSPTIYLPSSRSREVAVGIRQNLSELPNPEFPACY
jgi:hypothetical protein